MENGNKTRDEQAFARGYRAGFLDGLAAGRKRKVTVPDIMQQPVESLGVCQRLAKCLQAAGCQRVADVAAMPRTDIWRLRGVGKIGTDEIARMLHAHKIFGTDWDEFAL